MRLTAMIDLPRVETQSDPVSKDCCECDSGEEVSAELVVSGGDAAEILEAAEGVFDQMTLLVAGFVVSDFAFAIGPARDHRNGSGFAKAFAQGVGVIAFVGDQISQADGPFDQIVGNGDVGHIARCQEQGEGTSQDIG